MLENKLAIQIDRNAGKLKGANTPPGAINPEDAELWLEVSSDMR